MPIKYPISWFEKSVNGCLKLAGASILVMWVVLFFAPGVITTFILAKFLPVEAAAGFGALAWGAWILYWFKAMKLPQAKIIRAELDRTVKLCFRAHDQKFFEEENKKS